MEDLKLVKIIDSGEIGVLVIESRQYRQVSSLNLIYLESGHYKACGNDEFELIDNCESQAISYTEVKEDSPKD